MNRMLPADTATCVLFAVGTLSLTLYFTLLMKLKPSVEAKLSNYLEPVVEKKSPKRNRTPKPQKTTASPERNSSEEKACPHYVGYLTTLQKGSPFPDECFGCRKVIQCLRIEPTRVIESFYIQPTEEAQET
jgi:hypothetical protein